MKEKCYNDQLAEVPNSYMTIMHVDILGNIGDCIESSPLGGEVQHCVRSLKERERRI